MANGESIYDYDSIGNRLFAAIDAATNSYTANALNQYSAITDPVNTVNPVYDLDGNIITNGVWSFRWDAENRMVAAYSNDTLLVVNAFDDQSRRIRKVTAQGTRTFLYDGWNPVREVRVQGSGVSTNYYCWGTDLSGTLQGAGGVGGLLAVMVDGETPATYYPCYDANGNITAYVDGLGVLKAEYAFDAFGQTISQSGDMASTFSHRFSTKYADDETGLYYYGYRYYAPGLGRWVSRDPIEEEGGVNLYGFVGNESITYFDILGLSKLDDNLEVAGWAIGGVNSYQRSLAPSLFWNMSGGNNLISALQGELLAVAREIKFRKGSFDPTKKGGQIDISDGRVFLRQESGPESVVHELIHSYRLRQNGYWRYKMNFEEGVAHLSRRYHSAGIAFKMFERNYLSSASKMDNDQLKRGIGLDWNEAWDPINFKNSKHTFPYWGENPFEERHWNAFTQTFSMKVSCQQIAKEYNTVLALRGTTCLRLTCSEKKEGENDVPIGFKLPDSLK